MNAEERVLSPRADAVMRYAGGVFAFLAGASALTLVAAAVLQMAGSDLVNWVVWIRSAFYALGGVWLVALVRRARRRADRSAFVRIRIISILAPLGIAALVVSPDSGYPVWMKIEQACFGILLLPVAFGLLRPSVGRAFSRSTLPG
jgi:hypothetical protein